MTGDDDEEAAIHSSPLETFPPRLTMMVTFTDRLTGASTDGSRTRESSRGKKSESVRRETESVGLAFMSSWKASEIEKNGSVFV